jgi:hypothetical protein
MSQDSHIFSFTGRQEPVTKGVAVFLIFFLLITACGGSTGTDGPGLIFGGSYGKKTAYDISWRIVYYVGKDSVYTNSWSLAYHLDGNNV